MSEEIRLNHLPSANILPGIKISDIYRQTNKPKHNMNDKMRSCSLFWGN